MPIYEYRCENGHTFEVMQKMTDDPVSVCSTCEAPVQRVFHPVAVHFKGKGFYNTDYGTKRRNRELERSGGLIRGELRPGGTEREWCDPDVLRRLRRASLATLRKEVEPAEQRAHPVDAAAASPPCRAPTPALVQDTGSEGAKPMKTTKKHKQ